MDNLVYPRQQCLQNPEATATVIHAILREQYGEEVYDWDPTTVYLETQADFRADMCSEATNRWCAMQVVMTSDAFFKRLDAFMAICNALNDGAPFFSTFNPVSVEEAAWAISEVALNREMLPFAYAVRKYLKMILAQEGFNEGNYPQVFEEVFGPQPDADKIRDGLAAMQNDSNIGVFLKDQLADLVAQFNRIPDLAGLDDIILQRGLEEALQVTKGEQP